MTNKIGRPRTTVDDLPPDWRDIMLQLGQEGGSAVEVRCALGIGISAWETLLADSEDFRETEMQRQHLCESWWHSTGRRMVTGAIEKGSAPVWIFNMKNRFGWRDKQELSGPDGAPLQVSLVSFLDVKPDDLPE